jgi:hypothetical protein
MSFDPKTLPPTVYEIYQKGSAYWMFTVLTAIQLKITDINLLTNIAFFMHYPELYGRAIRSDEKKLIADWQSFRARIKPLLDDVKNSSDSSNTASGGGWGSSMYQYSFSWGATQLGG